MLHSRCTVHYNNNLNKSRLSESQRYTYPVRFLVRRRLVPGLLVIFGVRLLVIWQLVNINNDNYWSRHLVRLKCQTFGDPDISHQLRPGSSKKILKNPNGWCFIVLHIITELGNHFLKKSQLGTAFEGQWCSLIIAILRIKLEKMQEISALWQWKLFEFQ